jgi:hypothetical protein
MDEGGRSETERMRMERGGGEGTRPVGNWSFGPEFLTIMYENSQTGVMSTDEGAKMLEEKGAFVGAVEVAAVNRVICIRMHGIR